MKEIIARILTAKRKLFFGSKPVFEPQETITASELAIIEIQKNILFPADLKAWYLEAGFGNINDVLNFSKGWLEIVDRGPLKGHVFFSQDDLGNFFSFSPTDDSIHYICRSEPIFGLLSKNFITFLSDFERHDFQLEEWVNSIETAHYDWRV